ncbi:MAG: inositol-3-phosphate synthase [Thermodesulfobacteriota bacterium]
MASDENQKRKVGLWLIGARGAIAATVMIGAFLLRKDLCSATGMVTAAPAFADLDLLPAGDFVFGGCDIRREPLRETAWRAMQEGIPGDRELFDRLAGEFAAVEADISPGTCRNCGAMIQGLAETSLNGGKTVLEELACIRGQISAFRQKHGLDAVVVINLASTEPPLALASHHYEVEQFAERIAANDGEAVQASTLYAYAAIQEGCPYINFTPSNGALIPALISMAERKGVPVMGNDGKTGETLVKSALAPLFLSRNLQILSWEGVNMLGNMDGQVLNDPKNCQSKLQSKDQVLQKILGYAAHSRVHINYVPSLGDQKTAWDFIHFQGFLGAKMSLQFTWQGYDSILAAPLVLDLARLADLAQRHGEAGLMPQLASFFKSPLGVDEYRHAAQYAMLLDYAARKEDSAKR